MKLSKEHLELKTGEILIVAGKDMKIFKFMEKIFSDKKVILKIIKLKNRKLSTNIKLNILNELSKLDKISIKTKIKNASINSKEIKKNDVFLL